MSKEKVRSKLRKVRHLRVRTKVSGTTEVPRVSVFKSLRNLVVQAIDDTEGKTICYADSRMLTGSKTKKAKELGVIFGKRLLDSGVKRVVFDRGGYIYHGVIKILADSIRSTGVEF